MNKKWHYNCASQSPWEKIVVFDTETTRIMDEDFQVERFSPKMIFGVLYDGANFIRFKEGEEDKVKEICSQYADKGYKIVAHNLEFDLLRLVDNVFRDAESVLFRNRILSATFKWSGKQKVVWIDSMNVLSTSVEQIGKMLGRPKRIDLADYNKYVSGYIPSDADWLYCEEDCAIVYDGIKFLKSHIENMGGYLKLTLASTAFSMAIPNLTIAEKHPTKNVYYMSIDTDLQNIGEQSYKGGMTRAIEKGDFFNMAYYDINSAYPYAMTFPFPDPRYCNKIENPQDSQIMLCLEDYEGFAEVTIQPFEVVHPYIAYKCPENNMAYYPKHQKFQTVLTFPELRYLYNEHSARDYIFTVNTIYYARRIDSPFKDFIKCLYSEKERAGLEGHIGERWIYKIILNSCYGKFAQRDEDLEFIPDVDTFLYETRQSYIKGQIFNRYKEWEDNFIEHVHWTNKECTEGFHLTDRKPSDHALFTWASYITARARVQLWPYLPYAVYCDTDSIITPASPSIPKPPIGDQLGEFKLEGLLDIAKIRGKKWYEYTMSDGHRVVKIKGVDIRHRPEATVDDAEYFFYRMLKSRGTIRSKDKAGDFILEHKQLLDYDDETIPEKYYHFS